MHSMIYFNPLRNEADFSFLKNKKENVLYNTSWRLVEKTIKRQKLTKKKKQGKVLNVFKASKKRFRKERQLKTKKKISKTC